MDIASDVRSKAYASMPAWQALMLVIGILAEMLLAGNWYGFAAVLTQVTHDLALTPAQAGLVQGIFAITYCAGMLIWSPLVRRISARAAISGGLIGSGLFMGLQGSASGAEGLMAARLAVGFFDGAVYVGTMKLVFAWFPVRRHGAVIAALLAAYSLAILLDFAIGVPVAQHYGWRTFFYGLAVGTLVVGLASLLFVRADPVDAGMLGFRWHDESERRIERKAPLSSVLRSRWLYVCGASIFGATFALSATATWVVPAFVAVQNMPIANAAQIGITLGLSQIFFLLVGGWTADRVSRTAFVKLGAALATVSALVFLPAMQQAYSWPVLLCLVALSGVAVLAGGATFSLASEKFGRDLAPSAIGFSQIFGVMSSFLAPALMGWIIGASHSYAAAFAAFGAVEFAAFVIILVLARNPPLRTRGA